MGKHVISKGYSVRLMIIPKCVHIFYVMSLPCQCWLFNENPTKIWCTCGQNVVVFIQNSFEKAMIYLIYLWHTELNLWWKKISHKIDTNDIHEDVSGQRLLVSPDSRCHEIIRIYDARVNRLKCYPQNIKRVNCVVNKSVIPYTNAWHVKCPFYV